MERVLEAKLADTYPFSLYRWPNGLRAVFLQNPISPVAAYLTHYTVGSAHEEARQRGLAHFFEHMMFRETDSLGDGDFDKRISEMGGVGLNAYTTYDTTAYYVNVPSSRLEALVGLEADRMAHLRLSPDLIDKERGAVIGEINMYNDIPSDVMWNSLMATAFTHHPYHHPIIGYADQVAAFGQQDFQAFYATHYAPDRALIVVVGGFDEQEALKLIGQAYGAYPPGGGQAPPPPPEPPFAKTRRVELRHPKISSDVIYLAAQTPGLGHPDTPALALLSWVLSAGLASPFHHRLVNGGLATHAGASLLDTDWMMSHPSLFLMDVDMAQGVAAEKGEAEVRAVLEELAQGIPQADFERAANQMRLSHYSSLRTNMAMARYLARSLVATGDPCYADRLHQAMERVTPEQLVDVLRRYLLEKPWVIVTQKPGEAQ